MTLLGKIYQTLTRGYSFLFYNIQRGFLKKAKYDTVVVRLRGKIIDAPMPRAIPFVKKVPGIQFVDIISLLKWLAHDKKVKTVIFRIGPLGLGWAQAQEIADYMKKLTARGKKTIAFFDRGGNVQYYLAACCEKIYAPPSAHINLTGLILETVHLKGALAKLDVKAEIFAKGKYKSAAEMFLRTSPSTPAKEMTTELLDGIYNHIVDHIRKGRKTTKRKVQSWIDKGPYGAVEGKRAGLIDKALYYEEFLSETKKEKPKPVIIKAGKYFRAWSNLYGHKAGFLQKGALALIYAHGSILDSGTERKGAGVITDKLCEDIRKVYKDNQIKAVVVRVNSPGGAVLASDLIYQSLARLKKRKPVIVSMGNVAASGGYYIAMAGEKVFAQPATITGSIGVIIGKFSLKGLYQKLGMNKYQFKRGKNASIYSEFGAFTESEKARIKSLLNMEYKKFLSKTAKARGMKNKDVEKYAQGRVFLGEKALEAGLIDKLGGLFDALDLAKQKMGLAEDDPVGVLSYPKPKTIWKSLLSEGFFSRAIVPSPLFEMMDDFNDLSSIKEEPQYRMSFNIRIK